MIEDMPLLSGGRRARWRAVNVAALIEPEMYHRVSDRPGDANGQHPTAGLSQRLSKERKQYGYSDPGRDYRYASHAFQS